MKPGWGTRDVCGDGSRHEDNGARSLKTEAWSSKLNSKPHFTNWRQHHERDECIGNTSKENQIAALKRPGQVTFGLEVDTADRRRHNKAPGDGNLHPHSNPYPT